MAILDEQMSNKVGVKHQPACQILLLHLVFRHSKLSSCLTEILAKGRR